MDDVENVEWIDSLTEVELKKELLDRVKLVGTLRQHRDALIEVVYERVWARGETIGVSSVEIGTRERTERTPEQDLRRDDMLMKLIDILENQ